MEETDILTLFNQYKQVCQQRLDGCDLQVKEAVLEMYLSELLEQNELLINTVVELQKEARNRSVEMEKRLALSANRTEEVVLALNSYEMDIKKIISDRIAQVEAADVIEELNNHILALTVENSFLREQNDNLKHDLNNLIEMMKRKIGEDSSQDTRTECLTFCDVDPEDVFGPIETILANGSSVDEEVQVAIDNEAPSRCSSSSSFRNNHKFLVEEKEVLISKLQEHLQSISKQLELKDELVGKLEIKLNATRKENSLVKASLADLDLKNQECDSKLQEAIERISVLNDQKQSLMIQLDEESEQRIQFKDELTFLNSKLEENMKIVEQQSMTIQHLREAIVNRCKSEASGQHSAGQHLNGSTHVNGLSPAVSSQQNL